MSQLNHFLAIETATDACSISICHEGKIDFCHDVAPKRHSELLLPNLDLLLEARGISLSDLTAVVVGEGPGSFTGVRMALSVAQGLCLAANLQAYQIPTLLALALSGLRFPIKEQGSVIVALDARMGEVYAQRFEIENAILIPQGTPCLGKMENVLLNLIKSDDSALLGIGNGFEAYSDRLPPYQSQFSTIQANCYPHAGHFSAHLLLNPHYAKHVETFSELSPSYIRDKVTY
jgi:tRNA threonylcarbamoyladenosine biosynthesis protein TsaB